MKPFEGLTVVDLGEIHAGPQVGAYFADMGANVIKVEPKTLDSIWTAKAGNELVYISYNRGKRSIVLDYKSPKGVEALLKICAKADIFIENSRPGKAESRGYGYDVMKKINPRIIYLSISAFGRTGPYSHKPAVDWILQGVSGVQTWTGPVGGDPVRIGPITTDFAASSYGIAGILTALYVREKTGKGQKVDVSLLHAVLHMYPQRLIHWPVRGTRLRPMGTHHPWNHPGRGYKTKDGTLNVMVQEEWRWPGFCKAIGLPELTDDPRFKDTDHRAKNRVEMDKILEPHFLTKTNREWMDLLEAENQYCGEMNYLEDVLDHPQVVAEKMLVKMPYPNSPDTPGSKMENVRYVDVCARLSDTPGGVEKRAPIPGEHTDEILREFGFSDKDIESLKPVTTPVKPARAT